MVAFAMLCDLYPEIVWGGSGAIL